MPDRQVHPFVQTVPGRPSLSFAIFPLLSRVAHRGARIALFASALLRAPVAVAADAEGVLVIHTNQRPTPAAVMIEDTLRVHVPEKLGRPVRIFSEYLDLEWLSDKEYGREQAEFLRHKYSGRNVRVVTASAGGALEFALAYRDRMFPGTPIVHIAVADDALNALKLPPDVVGRTVNLDPAPTLGLALNLHPDAGRVVVVLGAASRDRAWEQRIRAAIARLEKPVQVEYLSALPTSEILRRVALLRADAVVYTPGYFSDGTRDVVTPYQSVERIAKASGSPVYGALDTFIGAGVVGGYVTPYREQAKEAGDIIVRLLNGVPVSAIDQSPARQVAVVDYRQLRRWTIDEGRLPKEATVLFREPTLWDRYKYGILIGLAVFLTQAILIAALLIERRSRRSTAGALEESREQLSLAASAADLSHWVWEMARGRSRTSGHEPRRRTSGKDVPMAFEEVMTQVHPADRQSLQSAVSEALASGGDFDVEYRRLEPGGNVRWIEARGRAEKGNTGRLLGIALDVTERKNAELRAAEDRTALRHMTRVSMVGQLSAAIAHQLNQPLASILGNAESARKMLEKTELDVVELRSICDDIVNEDHRATEVIRRLSDLYKRGDMTMEAIDLNRLVEDTLELVRTELLIRHVTPIRELAEDLPPIEAAHVQLQQVVMNLVLNAAEALGEVTDRERRLTLRTELHVPDVRLFVSDNGPGIPVNETERIFDPFWSTKKSGMGMGLAICRSIVRAHRGSISAANGERGGATFCVTLPIRQTP